MIKEGTDLSTQPMGLYVCSSEQTNEPPRVESVMVRASDCKCKVCGQQADVFSTLIPGYIGKPLCFSCATKVEDEFRAKIVAAP